VIGQLDLNTQNSSSRRTVTEPTLQTLKFDRVRAAAEGIYQPGGSSGADQADRKRTHAIRSDRLLGQL